MSLEEHAGVAGDWGMEGNIKSSHTELSPVSLSSPCAAFFIQNVNGFLFGAENLRGKEGTRDKRW